MLYSQSEYYDNSPYGMPFQHMVENQHLNLTPSPSSTTYNDARSVRSSVTAASSFTSGQSPRLIDLLLPGTDLSVPPPDYMDFRPQQSDRPYTPGGFPPLPHGPSDPDGDIEEVIREPYRNAESWVMRLPSPSPSSSSSSSEGSRFDNLNSFFQQPSMSPSSPEMLMARFDRQTCGILSVKDGPTENPWRTMIWPLAQDSPALYHAISAMTAFHTSKEKPELRVAGMEHMRCSIMSLASGLGTMRTDTALATTLALAFSESWDRHISTGIEHLRGAKILVNQALARHKQSALNQEDLKRLKFLCNTWVYMDVIARLTSVDDDDSNVFDTIIQPPLGPLSLSSEIDPLMGCASTLFPLVGRVANLVRKVRKTPENTINIISQGNELKTAIEEWAPPSFFTPPEDPSSEIQHSIQTAEAYRWATLLYLHQAVPEIPSETASKLAQKALLYLATVPLTSRAIIVQIYPLLAAGCEAIGHEDRAWVQDRWAIMSHRMLIGNIDRCWEVTKEVWDRRDVTESDMCRQRHRRATQRLPSGYTSPVRLKRESSNEEECTRNFTWSDFYGNQRKGAEDFANLTPPIKCEQSQRTSLDLQEDHGLEKTVRGRLHWVGVMKDWKWEGTWKVTSILEHVTDSVKCFLAKSTGCNIEAWCDALMGGQSPKALMVHIEAGADFSSRSADGSHHTIGMLFN